MPITRQRRTRGPRQGTADQIDQAVRFALESGESPDPSDPAFTGCNHLEAFDAGFHGREELWSRHRDVILSAWVAAHPGTRPAAWWQFDAPRATSLPGRAASAVASGRVPAPRRRRGGVGTPNHEVLNFAPELPCGIAVSYVDAWDVAFYNGRAKDVDGNPIGTKYSAGDFIAEAFDPDDPPRFESEAAYLERHRLFAPGEHDRLPADAFDETVVVDEGEDGVQAGAA